MRAQRLRAIQTDPREKQAAACKLLACICLMLLLFGWFFLIIQQMYAAAIGNAFAPVGEALANLLHNVLVEFVEVAKEMEHNAAQQGTNAGASGTPSL